MKTVIALLAVLAMAMTAQAAPYIVCDPQAGVTSYAITGPSWVPATVTAQPDGSIRMDIANATVGNNSLGFRACKNDPIWGTQCSASSPFSFVRPAAPVVPGGLSLVP